MITPVSRLLFAPLLCLALSPGLAPAAEAPAHPLLMAGKQSLYQRVLTIPGARLSRRAGWRSEQDITPFTAYYVYAREQVAGRAWLQVGTDRFGGVVGWLANDQTIAWNQGLTVAFRDPLDNERALLFRDADSLDKLAEQHDTRAYHALYEKALAGTLAKDSPVVAIQPASHIDIQKNFYLVPIREYRETFLGSEKARLLRVASVPLQLNSGETAAQKKQRYSAGLAFVIDSTQSMGPYIERTRQAVSKVYDALGDAGLLGHVNFALVGFRDAPAARRGLDYRAKTFVTLDQGRNPASFMAQVNGLKPARVSSRDFQEDAYAGVYKAINALDWSGHHARYLVLITDAGAREGDDPLSGTGMSAEGLRQIALDKGIAIFVLHLKTPRGKANHAEAEKQYKVLSHFPGLGSLYYGVPTGNVKAFGKVLDTLAGQITMQVRVAAAGQPPEPAAPPAQTAQDDPQLAALQSKVAKLGYALRLRYLKRGQAVPKVFDAWLLDRDFNDPERPTLDVRVLLTRDQLSDLHDVLKRVLATAEEGLLSPQNFLNELKSLAASVARDPERIAAATATAGGGQSLADLGFMREYIEDLPYRGEVMNLSLEDWETWPAGEQIAFLNRLEQKIGYYRSLHDHTDLWVSLDGGPIDGDSVFPVPLDLLP
jgi:serine/threonine-protein kinase PpkA